MSTGQLQRHRSTSRSSKSSASRSNRQPPPPPPPPAPSTTPKNEDFEFEPCAATGSFFLYAQRNVILCLHHDTLAIERRFDRHREDVLWISVDNVSERGAGRLVVSYDTGNTAIVWDLLTGEEVSRFASYEHIQVATWMRNGNVAFGNSQGNVILFEPSTSEHISARTIFDPITALAPGADCRTFAIGYLNGSILVATLQPVFTILHTLTTPRQPSAIKGLAWHGSSSKQKSEMLATLTADGDLRVWSVPKSQHNDSPCVIRLLNRSETREPGPCWFAWSKNGRIVQYVEGQCYAWDVRTKKVTYETVPTIDGVTAIANFGPTATLFTLGRNHTVQQYDLNPNSTPMLVANVQHVPANAPPSPPNSIEEKMQGNLSLDAAAAAPALPVYLDTESSEGEGATMSPLQKIAQEMDQLEEERRDRLGPLSPVSSASSASSRSSAGPSRRRHRWGKASSRVSTGSGSEGTIFSSGSSSIISGRESVSVRSLSSASSRYRPSGLGKEVHRSQDEAKNVTDMDLFPYIKARLTEVPFRPPQLTLERTPDDLRRQMLSVVFGWDHDIEELIRDELSRHPPGSTGGVLLSKWLGDTGADMMASMIGSEGMSSSDWMLLALSSMGGDQKKVGQAFVQRLLEKGDIHPAAAIFLGLGEQNDAVEVYVSRKYYMEAVLLTCLLFPTDWQRQSYLVRKWGEQAVGQGQAELAVRCFSCTSLESSEPWFSPRAQDEVFAAQQRHMQAQLSPPLSPPSATAPNNRLKNSSLKLITNFGDKAPPKQLLSTDESTPMPGAGVTPIAQTALSPSGGTNQWLRPNRGAREPSTARTATPGGFNRIRLPSRSRGPSESSRSIDLGKSEFSSRASTRDELEPHTAIEMARGPSPFTTAELTKEEEPMLLSAVAYDPNKKMVDSLPSPAQGVFTKERESSRSRNGSRVRKPEGLALDVSEPVIEAPLSTRSSHRDALSPGGASVSGMSQSKVRSIDEYISSLEEANHYPRQRAVSRQREESRSGRARSRTLEQRDQSEARDRSGARYIRPAKRSPSSPVPMSPEDAGKYSNNANENFDDERYYQVTSPVESVQSRRGRDRSRSKPRMSSSEVRPASRAHRRPESPERETIGSRAASRTRAASRRRPTPELTLEPTARGRSQSRTGGSLQRSPSSPLPMSSEAKHYRAEADDDAISDRSRTRRDRSSSRRSGSRAQSMAHREASPDRVSERHRSRSRRPSLRDPSLTRETRDSSPERGASRASSRPRMPRLQTDLHEARGLSRKELAARELEERRLSLARRPSAPVIPHPGELSAGRPPLSGRSATDMGASPVSGQPPLYTYSDRISRSQSADPEAMRGLGPKQTAGTSTKSTPIGLPATPRAMRHPRYISTDPKERESIPAVPEIPSEVAAPQQVPAQDDVPLLPSTVYGQPAPVQRAASAPPEKFVPTTAQSGYHSGLPSGPRRSSISNRAHVRKTSISSPTDSTWSGNGSKRSSPPPITASIDETLHNSDQVVIIEQPDAVPPILPELQHLAGPPPPPPPPSIIQHGHSPSHSGVGVINIAIDEEPRSQTVPPVIDVPSPPGKASTSSSHRRGTSMSENVHGRIRSVANRIRERSASRSRAKSPPVHDGPSPYETIIPGLPFTRQDSTGRSMSPDSGLTPYESIPPPPPPPPPPADGQAQPLMEQVIPPKNNAFGGYRNPKEIRANMPPEQLQLGVTQPIESPTGMI